MEKGMTDYKRLLLSAAIQQKTGMVQAYTAIKLFSEHFPKWAPITTQYGVIIDALNQVIKDIEEMWEE